ncbi:hypothetical protein ABPG74_013839 [Tetrahymena malaccensis]
MNLNKRHQSEKSLIDILQKKDNNLNFTKDREETLSNYAPHSTTSQGFKRKIKFRYTEDEDWEHFKDKKQNKPQLTRVIFRSNRPNDPLSNDIYKKHYEPIMTTTSYNNLSKRDTRYASQDFKQQRVYQEEAQKNGFYETQKDGEVPKNNLKGTFYNQNKDSFSFNRRNMSKSSQIQPQTNYSTRYQQLLNHNQASKYGQQNTRNNLGFLSSQRSAQKLETQKTEGNEPSKQVQLEDHVYTEREKQGMMIDPQSNDYDDMEEQALFDQISNQDWYQLLPEEVLNNKNIDLEKFFIDNSEYFYNLLCQNAQIKSNKPFFFNNDQQTAKLKYNQGFNTTYNKQFFRKTQQFPSKAQITDKMRETQFLGQKQIDYTSQKQSDYKNPGVQELERRVQQYQPSYKPFMGLTNYKSNFVNWQDYQQQFQKAPQHLSTLNDIPFFGKTSYQEAFGKNKNQKGEVAEIDRKSLFKGPIPTYPIQFGETHYATTYRPFLIKPTNHSVNNTAPDIDPPTNESKFRTTFYSQIPSFQGQYKSMSQREYGPQRDHRYLANKLKKIWRNKILQKLEELKSLKQEKQIEELRQQVQELS